MRQPYISFNARYRTQGFTLLEVLVTLVVLSIGLLGLAGMQLNGLQSNHSAYLRSQATILTQDIADRMRANRISTVTGAYDIALGDVPAAVTCTGVGANCPTSALANADLSQWKTHLADSLPQGDGAITRVTAGAITLVTITVQWDDSKGQNDPVQLTTETLI